jgi:hypothetical protein
VFPKICVAGIRNAIGIGAPDLWCHRRKSGPKAAKAEPRLDGLPRMYVPENARTKSFALNAVAAVTPCI